MPPPAATPLARALRTLARVLAVVVGIPVVLGCCCPAIPDPGVVNVGDKKNDKDKKDKKDGEKTGDGGEGDGAAPRTPARPVVVPAAAPTGRRLALLVGIAEYGPELGNLLYPEDDVTALADVLRAGGYAADDVVVMTASGAKGGKEALRPTTDAILVQLRGLLARCKAGDLVLVALAGHGIEPTAGNPLFCTAGSSLANPAGMLPLTRVLALLNESPATTKILLVDACREVPGGRAPARREAAPTDVPSVTNRAGTATIAYFSCKAGEKSWEADDIRHGLFFDQVIKGLAGEADTYPDGQVTLGELHDHVERNMGFAAARYKGRQQSPHFKGETIGAGPLVVLPRAGELAPRPLALGDDAVNEDFRGVATGALPRGWDGPGFSKTYDEKAKRACLEVRKARGAHTLTVPFARPVAGDFAAEIEFRLAGAHREESLHGLTLTLEGEGGHPVPVYIHFKGAVEFANTQGRATQRFKEGEINRLRLVRQGTSYALFLNDGDAASTTIPYTGQVSGLQLRAYHLPREYSEPTLVTRLYSVKVGGAPGDPAKVGSVVLRESPQARGLGAVLPSGWQGPGYSVATDEKYDLRCLEVNKPEHQYWWLAVPGVAAGTGGGRAFALDLDARLYTGWENHDGDPGRAPSQEMIVRLEGPGAVPLTVVLNPGGTVRVGEQDAKAPWFYRNELNRFRLVHVGGVYTVYVNGVLATEFRRPAGNYTGLLIGMTGGNPQGEYPPARLFGVALTALPAPAAPVAPFTGIVEDFLTTPVGGGPAGWGGENVGCKHGHGRLGNRVGLPGLELVALARPGAVTVPNLKLAGDFSAGAEFTHHELYEGTFALTLTGPAKGAAIGATVSHKDSKYWLSVRSGATPYPPADITNQIKDRTLRLGMDRAGGFVQVLVNGQVVGRVPVGKTPAEYATLQVGLANTSARYSPRLTQVFAVPR